MALITPIVSTVNAFDATYDHIIPFVASGGDQIIKNEIEIINNTTSVVVYTNIATTFALNQTVVANTLTNGIYYAVRFRTYDVSNNTSSWSNYVPFYCYTNPSVLLNIIDGGTISASSFNFEMIYNQIEDELLDYAIMELYSASGVLIF